MYATLTNAGRAAMLKAISDKVLYFGWGSGDEAWDADSTLQPNLLESTGLTNEVGRRLIQVKYFVTPDDDGEISLPESYNADGTPVMGTYTMSDEPTQYLFMRVTFDYGDASTETIREVGVFSDTVVSEDAPAGQLYFEPDEVVSGGSLLSARHEVATVRDPARKDSYEFILSL
ncbi:MAG: hypothetical protein R3Y11_01720 [Pseudomonadota bacterium]